MMMVQWFVFLKNKNENDAEDIKGPYSSQEVQDLNLQGQLQDEDLIWGRPQSEWKPIRWWKTELPTLLQRTQEIQLIQPWHYAINNQAHGPFPRQELIQKLKNVTINSELLLWTKGMKAWASIFEFNDILNEIGMNKRLFPRADITGRVLLTNLNSSSSSKISTAESQTQTGMQILEGHLLTISEGGFGATQLTGLSIGQILSIQLECDGFHNAIHAKAEVRYITDQGYVGFRFQNINMEARSIIIQYVKSANKSYFKAAA